MLHFNINSSSDTFVQLFYTSSFRLSKLDFKWGMKLNILWPLHLGTGIHMFQILISAKFAEVGSYVRMTKNNPTKNGRPFY